MSTLVLLHYNNYYNRIVKKENSLNAYLKYQIGDYILGVNFIPNDYINTTQIVNWTYEDPDYLLVINENNEIVSRWFVISTTKLRSGQLQLELHRDLVVDYYDNLINAPMFIEKARIMDINDPAIYNKEDMTFNQIKTGEFPLTDKSLMPWIVGYVAKNAFPEGQSGSIKSIYQGLADIEVDNLSEYTYYDYISTGKEFAGIPENVKYGVNAYLFADVFKDVTINMDGFGNYIGISDVVNQGAAIVGYLGNRPYRYIGDEDISIFAGEVSVDGAAIFRNFTLQIVADMNSKLPDYIPASQASTGLEYYNFMSQNGKIIHNKSDNQHYRIKIDDAGNNGVTRSTFIASGALYNTLYNNLPQNRFIGSPNEQTFKVTFTTYNFKMSLELLSTDISFEISAPNKRYHLIDSPYDMFCMPFPAVGQNKPLNKNGSTYINSLSRDAAFAVATEIASQLGKDNIYDVQLLPYCPITNIIKEDYSIDIGDILSTDIIATIVLNEGTANEQTVKQKVSVLLWGTTSEFQVRIPFEIPAAKSVTDKKVKSQTEMWRLCSPNYSGVFEFDPQKNNGVSEIIVDCNYKPFNPYIHAAINFNNLYGKQWGDSRGLICGGDFSLPQITSAWADYQLSNKNYQQMFDRQIQNMEVNNAVQREREVWGIASGALGAGVQGASAGMIAAGPYGALAGIGTAGLSLAGGLRDLSLNDKLRSEALDYKKDMFGYQLQNIQALPQGLAKVSAFTANNKIFPFLERYNCTKVEEEALKNKIAYNGMTIMRIGTIQQFQHSQIKDYVKGRLIRIDDINEDYHIINAIADELYKGVFI